MKSAASSAHALDGLGVKFSFGVGVCPSAENGPTNMGTLKAKTNQADLAITSVLPSGFKRPHVDCSYLSRFGLQVSFVAVNNF